MTVKQYLNQIKVIKAKIADLQDVKEELRDQMGRVMGVSYEGERVQTSVHGDAMFKRTVRLMELEAEYDKQQAELVNVQKRIISEIHSLADADEIRTLYLRYVSEETFEQIADDTSWSRAQVFRIHDRALASFERAFPEKFEGFGKVETV